MGQILQYFLTWTLFLSRLPPVHRLGHGRSGPDLQSADPDPDLLSDRGSSDGRPVRPRRLCCGHGLRQVHRQPAAQGEAHGSAPGPRDPDSSGPGSGQDFIYYYYLNKKTNQRFSNCGTAAGTWAPSSGKCVYWLVHRSAFVYLHNFYTFSLYTVLLCTTTILP